MHIGDTIFIFCLALILFGPKKLPEIGRQIGKLMVEFRRASNEFKMQIEEELRASEESERQKEITAATTMMPTPTPTAAASILETSAASIEVASAPVIAPPITGVPVNHTFSSTPDSSEQCSYQATLPEEPPAAQEDAYPEPANGFNPGLNAASNGLIAETPVAESILFQSETVQPEAVEVPLLDAVQPELGGLEFEKTQAPVHHG